MTRCHVLVSRELYTSVKRVADWRRVEGDKGGVIIDKDGMLH